MRPHCRTNHHRGFTLIEGIATMAVLAAIGSMATSIMMTAMDGYTDSAIRAQLHAEESVAMDRIARELRKVQRDMSASSIAPMISSVTASSIAWNANCSLSFSGTSLNFVENGAATRPLLQSVSAFAIQTYDEVGTALGATLSGAECYPIRCVQVSITMQRNGVSEMLRTRVYIRPILTGSG